MRSFWSSAKNLEVVIWNFCSLECSNNNKVPHQLQFSVRFKFHFKILLQIISHEFHSWIEIRKSNKFVEFFVHYTYKMDHWLNLGGQQLYEPVFLAHWAALNLFQRKIFLNHYTEWSEREMERRRTTKLVMLSTMWIGILIQMCVTAILCVIIDIFITFNGTLFIEFL